jgi:hypothetical protein
LQNCNSRKVPKDSLLRKKIYHDLLASNEILVWIKFSERRRLQVCNKKPRNLRGLCDRYVIGLAAIYSVFAPNLAGCQQKTP